MKTVYASIENSFSYHKKVQLSNNVDRYDYDRYNFDEIVDLDVAGEAYNNEILNTKKFKIDLYNKIATV